MNFADAPYLKAMVADQRRSARIANVKLVVEAIGQGVAIVIIIVSWGLFLYAIQPSQAVVIGNYSNSPSPSEFAKAHKKHGISASYRDEKGWYFMRDGQRCKLFPKTQTSPRKEKDDDRE
jgi:hypothetical protein